MNERNFAIFLISLMILGAFFLTIDYLYLGNVLMISSLALAILSKILEIHKKNISELEKAHRQRIAIENYNNLWREFREMLSSGKIPEEGTQKWDEFKKRRRDTDKEYNEIGIEKTYLSLEMALVEANFRRNCMMEIYRLHWKQILEMIRNMNFPKKSSWQWQAYLCFYHLADRICLEYSGEKGELESTFRRMTE